LLLVAFLLVNARIAIFFLCLPQQFRAMQSTVTVSKPILNKSFAMLKSCYRVSFCHTVNPSQKYHLCRSYLR